MDGRHLFPDSNIKCLVEIPNERIVAEIEIANENIYVLEKVLHTYY